VTIAASPGTICFGTTVTFTATPTNGGSSPSFQWKLNGTNAGTNSPTFISNTLVNGDIISCLLTSNSVCAIPNTVPSNNITVIIDPVLCPMSFYMPTAFTPNKDGKNDVCKPTLIGNVLSYKFSVYNRWGQKIFETTDLQKGWDGKVSGFDTDSNVFIWLCNFQFQGQAIENRKGTVVLIR
jgi:gliding motility-associated-like protein